VVLLYFGEFESLARIGSTRSSGVEAITSSSAVKPEPGGRGAVKAPMRSSLRWLVAFCPMSGERALCRKPPCPGLTAWQIGRRFAADDRNIL
jgi:hypothetical protein